MVTLKTIDRLIGLLIVAIVLFGTYNWWQATQRKPAGRGMMSQMMGTMPMMDPIWYLFGTLIAVSVVLGVYIVSREQLSDVLSTSIPTGAAHGHRDGPPSSNSHLSKSMSEQHTDDSLTNSPPSERTSPLTFLPEDELRVVEPILESPGLTQVELRGRSDFSKAKVSQTVSKLEDRGLIYREKQGRTYRVYLGKLLKEQQQS